MGANRVYDDTNDRIGQLNERNPNPKSTNSFAISLANPIAFLIRI